MRWLVLLALPPLVTHDDHLLSVRDEIGVTVRTAGELMRAFPAERE